jgi:RNA polymerase sigma factor (sigma-70 family)
VRAAVRAALEKLKPADRLILQLRHCSEPVEYREIATELGMESGAARTRHSRATRRLAEFLRADPRMQKRLAGCEAPRTTGHTVAA